MNGYPFILFVFLCVREAEEPRVTPEYWLMPNTVSVKSIHTALNLK